MERNGSHRAQLVGRVGRGLGRWLLGPSGLVLHLGAFLLGATLLTLLNLLRSPGEIWFWRPLAWWGVLLAVHAGLTVGGAVRTAGARGSALVEEHRAASPRSASGGSRLRGGLVSRAGALPSFQSGDGATAATRRGDAGSPPVGWTPEDDAAFASWAQATDTWSAPRSDVVPTDVNGGGRRVPTPAGEGGPALRDYTSNGWGWAPNSVDHAVADRASGSPPAATGRFLANGSTRTGTATGPVSDVVTEEWVPPDVAALWGAASSAPHAADTAALPVVPPRPTGSSEGASVAAIERRRGRPNGRDVVLNGPVPIDPDDPQWTRLEAAAEAWLARRGTGPMPTPLRPTPVPTGTDGASTSQA